MIAPDTNVFVRVITWDDEEQAEAAYQSLQSDEIWIAKTVLLEVEWVLRHAYGLDEEAVNRALTRLVGLQDSTVEDVGAVEVALEWHENGMDFADALHLASCPRDTTFVTFDRKLAASAERSPNAPAVRRLD